MGKRKTELVQPPKVKFSAKEVKRQWPLLVWAAIFFAYGIVFHYIPLAGWIMAFQNYKPKNGLFHSKWIGMEKFKFLFSDKNFIDLTLKGRCTVQRPFFHMRFLCKLGFVEAFDQRSRSSFMVDGTMGFNGAT